MKMRFAFLLLLSFIAGCATQAPQSTTIQPLPFDEAAIKMSDALFQQFASNQSMLDKLTGKNLVVDQVIDADTGESTVATRRVEEYLVSAGRRLKFNVALATPQTMAEAHYIITGIIRYEAAPWRGQKEKAYRISASVVDIKSALVVANQDAWVANKTIQNQPVSIYADAPIYLKDSLIEAKIRTAQTAPGQPVSLAYRDALPSEAMIAAAGAKFDQGDYPGAIKIYQAALSRPDGRTLKTYAGLYQSLKKMNLPKDAEAAFAGLIGKAVEVNRVSIKFLFEVNSVDFYHGIEMSRDYPMWLRQLAKAVRASQKCLDILGHSSRSGTEQYNQHLSLQRAKYLQTLMQSDFPDVMQRSSALGRGFKDNIIGTGTDDIQDAVDRRVDFLIRECSAS
jgi:outer membrane protein OmpA-like peptidoglycan-associated protein